MNFSEVVNEVMNIVKRPDKLLDVRREVNSAINQFCMDANFDFDVAEISPLTGTSELTFAIPLTPTFERFRKIKYMKRGGTKHFLERLTRPELLKGTSCDFRDKYYIVGSNINVSLAAAATSLDIAYYQSPPTLADTDSFWMLDLSPYMVIDRAAAKLFTNIGDDTSAARHEGFALSAFRTANKDYGTSTQ